MKKFFFLVIVPALLIAVVIFLLIQYVQHQSAQKGALQVTSSPQSQVYLNDKYIGRTPVSKTEAQDMVQSGAYTIKLVPLDTKLAEYQEKIQITTGILTVVDRKFGKGTLSEGYVISLSPLRDKKQAELEVITFPSDAQIELDSNEIGKAPLLYKKPTESDHILRITKKGYREKAVRIRTPLGYRLTVVAYLSVNGDEPPSLSPTQVPVTITPTIAPAQITILQTPTGFLRVRQEADINSVQLTTVTPGQSFPLVSEQTGWYEIKLPDGKSGWISSEYAQKK